MKLCPRCNMQLEDSAVFCPNCGTQFIPNATASHQPYMPMDPADHTAEYETADVSAHKLFAMLSYLTSILGIIVTLLACRESEYAMFHVRQSLKIFICEVLLALAAGILAITIIVPVAAAVCIVILFVVRIICFFRVCSGKAVEAPIVKNLGFLK